MREIERERGSSWKAAIWKKKREERARKGKCLCEKN